ncbi:hypothetical protein B0J14DRAFT_700397 [Halenospora varia]|nr:hypothetical protein B0J14DRAFT_700397 [Halenospora varia]
MSLLITTTSLILAANITMRVIALGTHPLYAFTRFYSGRANLPLSSVLSEITSASQSVPEDFTVHVFISHDPFIAPIFLPDLFTEDEFPDTSWKLPPAIPPPARPEAGQAAMTGELTRELWIDPRAGLGRYILPKPIPASTTLQNVAEILEQEFGINRHLIAHFTIFPQFHQHDGTYPPWHDIPLPSSVTLAEVSQFDHTAVNEGQYEQVSEAYAPVLHLVLETKAAALKRTLGASFMGDLFGGEWKYKPDMWRRVESFDRAHPDNHQEPEVVTRFRRWRHEFWALKYLRSQVGSQQDEDSDKAEKLSNKIKDAEKRKGDLRGSILALLRQWEEWVLGIESGEVSRELEDGDFEGEVRRVLGQRAVIREWAERRSSGGKLPVGRLRDAYIKEEEKFVSLGGKTGHYPGAKAKEKVLEEDEKEKSSQNEAASKLMEKVTIPSDSPITASSFRHPNGTWDPSASTFSIHSGILSWGQILPIYFGSTQARLTQNAVSIPDILPGGTIMQRVYTYKSAARNGSWKVRRYSSSLNAVDPFAPNAKKQSAGWVVHHEDVDPGGVVERVRGRGRGARGAVSNGNDYVDKDVLSIGRYDWSYAWHHPTNRDFEAEFYEWFAAWKKGNVLTADREKAVKKSGYFIAMDASDFNRDFVAAYKRDCSLPLSPLLPVENIFSKGERKFGTFVSDPRTEYEFAWLVFSGKKNEHGADELVAIIYDARYEVLEGLWHDVEGLVRGSRVDGVGERNPLVVSYSWRVESDELRVSN